MKAVLISIKPKWCELIANGEKTVEVRKTKPKIDVPFKCYIYCTKSKKEFLQSRNNMFFYCENKDFIGGHGSGAYRRLNGTVIGYFVCDRIDEYSPKEYEWETGNVALEYHIPTIEGEKTCLEYDEVREYGNEKPLYFWHITDLVIYDKPKELSEFKTSCKEWQKDFPNCEGCKYFIDGRGYEYDESDCACDGMKPIERPPQSWCYVEELGV